MIIILIFIAVAIVYYIIQKDKIRRSEKREDFKIRQEEKLAQLLKNAREEDRRNRKIIIYNTTLFLTVKNSRNRS
ncbi:hypothetical protein N0B16_07790 [Chryseobacterium sp. GMJ5]|uniref:Uncharacterized protein n=1 Tax=Chryseobacterium gilvum TaxID=2976534 RepID=A0ABT2VWF9_9FLAO|nr:hypothetical protein [Chryseobacterium gilvum]MCU7614336.1 hypothetical protein [Chryseobacterium gilvum]